MTTAAATSPKISGGAFLIEEFSPDEVFTAEDLSEEHLAIARTVDEFWANDVEPHLVAIRQQKPGIALNVLRKSADLGLTAVAIPERFGGMEMDLASVMIVGEHLGRDASYGSWHSAHTGIGTLPILFFGTEEQKQRYLPRLAKAEILAAYALTEPLAGSDALAIRTVLGEVGRGHIIAFNILNLGRLKLGPGALGAAKNVLAVSLKYAKERKAFGSAIAEFGAIQHKLAEMAIRIYVVESMVWRVVGLIESQLRAAPQDKSDASRTELKAVEEYAAECSMIKVYASEMLDYVVDEGVQIHGGYGYHQDYLVERAYRDSRVNRLFEGTNEINRLLIPEMLLKRAARGQLALLPAVQAVLNGKFTKTLESEDGDEETRLVHTAKQIALLAIGIANQKYGTKLQKQQEVLMSISDIIMEVLAMESTLLRSRKLAASQRDKNAADVRAVFLREAMDRIEICCRNVLGACLDGDALRRNMSALRSFASYDPVDAIARRRNIASRLLANERSVWN